MEELINQLKQKAGLTDEQATKAIEVLKDYIYGKVPPMFSGFVDNFFAKSKQDSSEELMP